MEEKEKNRTERRGGPTVKQRKAQAINRGITRNNKITP
jgi:hypothetical protein